MGDRLDWANSNFALYLCCCALERRNWTGVTGEPITIAELRDSMEESLVELHEIGERAGQNASLVDLIRQGETVGVPTCSQAPE